MLPSRLYDVYRTQLATPGGHEPYNITPGPQPYTLLSKARAQQGTAYVRYHEQCRSDLTQIVAYVTMSVCTVSVL